MIATTENNVGVREVSVTAIQAIDSEIARMPRVEPQVRMRFTPGLATREIFMEAGTAHRSKIHKTEHQFIVSQGSCFVSENGGPRFLLNAPYHGHTKPGTWRTLFIIQDCIWTTMHPTQKTTPAEVEAEIIAAMEDFQ